MNSDSFASAAPLFQEPDLSKARTRRRRVSRSVTSTVAERPLNGTDESGAGSNDHSLARSASSASSEAGSEDESDRREADLRTSPGSRRKRVARGSRALKKKTGSTQSVDSDINTRGLNEEDGQLSSSETSSQIAEDGENTSSVESPVPQARGRRRSTPSTHSLAEDRDAQASQGEDASAVTRRRRRRRTGSASVDEQGVARVKGSTRLEAKRQRRKETREAGRKHHSITEAEFLARRESVHRDMLVRERDGLNQIAVLEDGVLVEHYVARHTQQSMVGDVYLGRVQNVLPSMEAAFIDIGKGRNGVLYAGEVNWEAAGLEGKPRRIEQALKTGDTVVVQVTKDPIGHKGARLTAQITLAGRHLVLVPSGAMTGISRKLPETERRRLKKILKQLVPEEHGVIVRTAAEGATEDQLRDDVERLTATWDDIQQKAQKTKNAPVLLKGEPELAVRVVRDIFNEDFDSLKIQGNSTWATVSNYIEKVSPELSDRLSHWTKKADIFAANRVDEQLAKAFDRKVWLPSGGTLIIDRTEAMTVIDVNTGKFTGEGGTLEETVTRNNLEAAEEIVRQLRLRDIGGIIVVDFIDMVLESNRELVMHRLLECLGRDRTRHQVAEVTSLGLIQMTRKRVGQGLVEAFSTVCEACDGRGYITHTDPVEHEDQDRSAQTHRSKHPVAKKATQDVHVDEVRESEQTKAAVASIAAAGHAHTDAHARTETRVDGSDQSESVAATQQTDSQKTDSQADGSVAHEQDSSHSRPQQAAGTLNTPNRRSDKHQVVQTGTIIPGGSSHAVMTFPMVMNQS
ncbi:MAG: Rne/Rng family ribonuclease [Actinomycetaceae bacterium]|nr:Rne/Rng family ribonuclease [Actinomycetaceae bacterium]